MAKKSHGTARTAHESESLLHAGKILENCSICGKSQQYFFSEPLKQCVTCRRLYHTDCHKPRIDASSENLFSCSRCVALSRETASLMRPRKKSKTDRYSTPNSSRSGYITPAHVRASRRKRFSKAAAKSMGRLDSLSCTISPPRSSTRASLSATASVLENDNFHSPDSPSTTRRSSGAYHEYPGSNLSSRSSLEEEALKTAKSSRNLRRVSLVDTPLDIKARKSVSSATTAHPVAEKAVFKAQQIKNTTSLASISYPVPKPQQANTTKSPANSSCQVPKVYKFASNGLENPTIEKHGAKEREGSVVTDSSRNSHVSIEIQRLREENEVLVAKKATLIAKIQYLKKKGLQTENLKKHNRDLMTLISELEASNEDLLQISRQNSATITCLQDDIQSLRRQARSLQAKSREQIGSTDTHASKFVSNTHLVQNHQGDHFLKPAETDITTTESVNDCGTVPENNLATSDLQAKLFQRDMDLFAREQTITRLQRELERAKENQGRSMARIAHTDITTGAPLLLREALERFAPNPQPSRKQTFGRFTLHRKSEKRTKLKVDPLRWNAREQVTQPFRPLSSQLGDHPQDKDDNNSAQGSRVLRDTDNLGSQLSRTISANGFTTGEDHVKVRGVTQVDSDTAPYMQPTSSQLRFPSVRNPGSVGNSDKEHHDSDDNESSPITIRRQELRTKRTSSLSSGTINVDCIAKARSSPPPPTAVAAAQHFQQIFALDPVATPVVTGSRLAFRTGTSDGGRRRSEKNMLYRVGRNVLGEMR